jgi:hypothetical protein
MTSSEGRVRAYHPESGSVLSGEVTKRNLDGDVRLIPDGMLEEVILRAGVWTLTPLANERTDGAR